MAKIPCEIWVLQSHVHCLDLILVDALFQELGIFPFANWSSTNVLGLSIHILFIRSSQVALAVLWKT